MKGYFLFVSILILSLGLINPVLSDDQSGLNDKKKAADVKNQKKEEGVVVKPSEKDPQTGKMAPGKTEGGDKKEVRKKTNGRKEKAKLIKWENEAQKAKCNAYLEPLRENFLKARHYSIQGQSCETAEYAESFMNVAEKCKRDCPEGFLDNKGYKKKIIRNISWLKKLGAERCPE